jgi:hypothetical protein
MSTMIVTERAVKVGWTKEGNHGDARKNSRFLDNSNKLN